MPERRIAHLDMDAFYASVELLRYPQLRGHPVVIGGRKIDAPSQDANGQWHYARLRDYAGRGVITTATYEARALGIGSAMGIMKAAQIAPDAILLPVDFDAYHHYSRLFKAAASSIAPVMEDRGIDEIYLDLTDVPGETRELAQRIKDAVRAATGLSCSIGVTPNKLLSKICSDLDKPDGLTILKSEDVPARIWPLAARKINGIGPKAEQKLNALGIHSIGELAAYDVLQLQEAFGRSYGTWLHQAAHGIDERPVVTHSEPKSVSRETTFERDLHARTDRSELSGIFTRLCEHVSEDLQRKGVKGRTIGIKIRFEDFTTLTRDLSIPQATDNPAIIRKAAGECLKRVPLTKRLRLLGVRVGHLEVRPEDTPEDLASGTQAGLPF